MVEQHVFISGASSGIGRAAAQQLDARGWHVWAAALPGDDFTALQAGASPRLRLVPLDITDAAAVSHAAEEVAAVCGASGLTGLVNNAGINIPAPLEGLPLDLLRQQIEVNVIGHLQVIQAFLPLLRRSGRGRIVNISSIMGRVAMPLLGAYSLSKHALEGLSDVLRLELAAEGIRVAIVQPGAIATPMTDAMPALIARYRARLPAALQHRYATLYDQMQVALQRQAQQAMSPEVIVACIVHALSAPRPHTRYAPGAAASGLLLLRRLAPDAVADRILRLALGL